jgi:Mn-dependent DtxR family transcriptional regulator
VLLFCLASDTEWVRAGVTPATVQHMIVRNLVEREPAGPLRLTDDGRAVLKAMIKL